MTLFLRRSLIVLSGLFILGLVWYFAVMPKGSLFNTNEKDGEKIGGEFSKNQRQVILSAQNPKTSTGVYSLITLPDGHLNLILFGVKKGIGSKTRDIVLPISDIDSIESDFCIEKIEEVETDEFNKKNLMGKKDKKNQSNRVNQKSLKLTKYDKAMTKYIFDFLTE